MAHFPIWPALIEHQVDLAAGKSRSPFDWKALFDTMLKTQCEVEVALKKIRTVLNETIDAARRLNSTEVP